MNTINPRGSEWRKWDLHIHTPNSICQEYGNTQESWDKFISALENLPTDVKVIGITDYYFIDGYEKVMSYKLNNDRLKNIDKIFPVLEFRIDTFGSGNENNLQKINLHIIFDLNENDINNEINKVKEEFIKRIPVTKLDKHKTKYLSLENLTQEGENDLQKGFSSLIPPTDKVFELLNSLTWKDKCFLLLGYKEWSNLEKNQQLKPLKDDLYSKVGAFLSSNFANNENNQKWLNEFGNKRLLHSLDIHSFIDLDTFEFAGNNNQKNIEKYHCNTWIKADPTFEGLKQIIYEPDERVKIQETKPDEKRGYQVIDSIAYRKDNFWNGIIYFNENLNTIIGGRSTGKSTLLKSIAKKINANVQFEDEKDFIKNQLDGLTIKWNDGQENTERDIDFFPQSYMHEIAKDKAKTDELIKKIISDKEQNKFLIEYKTNNEELKKAISQNIFDIFQLQSDIASLSQQLKEKGDKTGVENEINRLTTKIQELSKNATLKEEELEKYQQYLKDISEKEQLVRQSENDLTCFVVLKTKSIIDNNYIVNFYNLSNVLKEDILDSFNHLKDAADKQWAEIIADKENSVKTKNQEYLTLIENIKESEIYKKGTQYYTDNKELNEVQTKLKSENTKLQEIKDFEEKITKLTTRKDETISLVITNHSKYNENAQNLVQNLKIEHDEVKIETKLSYKKRGIKDFLENRLNQQGNDRQQYINEFSDKYNANIAAHSNDFLIKALKNEIVYKSSYQNQNVITEFFITNWFDISFELSYQKDVFDQMSQGKQAFVILKLLLEFSTKECPILIDQPEDSLDNRAIYKELVLYLRAKKKERQIILVTHNPNVVVSADSENVIVANQEGKNSKNRDDIKFQYVNGALENTKTKTAIDIVLESQGIREHVCEILEGGKEAFEKREQKYGFLK